MVAGQDRVGAGRRYRVGVDVGGTFTDVVLVDEVGGEILVAKVPTVPADPSEGCLAGLDKALTTHGIEAAAIGFTVHGTTIATNTIIEGKGARVGLLTTAGFRDVLEIAYQTRPRLYDVFYNKPPPLIPRHRCLGVPGRVGPEGEVLLPLDEDAVLDAGRHLVGDGVEAIAIAFLHSYLNPRHERRAGAILERAFPGVPVVLSSDVCPEYREYPRTSTTVVNTVLLPRVGPYIRRLEERIGARGVPSGLHLMTSAGGIMAAHTAERAPIHLIESGPAAGVIGAVFIARLAGHDNLLALDIGGTTAKAALASGGEPKIADEFEVGSSAVATVTAQRGQGYPVRTPVISLIEIGAAGGSIAHIDPGGALAVGPQSAGADPGPVCYGRGGTEPTLTDACLVLGRINPDFFLGGETRLDIEAARRAIETAIAVPMGKDVIEAAHAIVAIATARIVSALYFISVQQGIDPRDHVLVASGGAGPMLIADVARNLGVETVLIPPTPGLNSALGLLATDLKHEVVRTWLKPLAGLDADGLGGALDGLETALRALLAEEGVAEADVAITRELEMCYVGQSYHLRVPAPAQIDGAAASRLADAFHARHEASYGFANRREPVQIVNLRVIAIGRVERPRIKELAPARDPVERARKGEREVWFDEAGGRVRCPLYDRSRLLRGDEIRGPAIVEQMDTTIVVSPGTRARVDRFGNLELRVPPLPPASREP